MTKADQLRQQILDLGKLYFQETQKNEFFPGVSYVPPSGKVLDSQDLVQLLDSSMDMWLTTGRFAKDFEPRLAKTVGAQWSRLVNSGSAANLIAFSTLTSPLLGERQITPGSEVITVAAGFPTTVAPIIQNQCIPVFVDIEIPTYNIDVKYLEAALSAKTKAIMVAHTLGNPFDLKTISEFAKKHNLWLIEDCCDALGATYNGQHVGTHGDLATLSFYPAHHITMGEGGAVYSTKRDLLRISESFRDWGRDCWCKPGVDNTCKKRYDWQMGTLPHGYDHKYIYSHIGYNLKVTDMQAAIGLSQLDKLEGFIAARRKNHTYITQALQAEGLDQYLILPKPTENSDPSWFGYMLSLQPNSRWKRNDLVQFLEKNKVGTRLLFGGNLVRQPAFHHVNYRVASTLEKTDFVMNHGFWIGIYPGLEKNHLDYSISILKKFFQNV